MNSMIDIFKKELQDGMEIVKCKEMANVYKITLSYNGMTGTCELSKMCAPNAEKSLCRKSIDTAISSMYINAGNFTEAKLWLDGEKWNVANEKKEFVIELTEKELEQIKYALEYLHDADLSDFGKENIIAMEDAMKKLGIEFSSQVD